jgi:hypothetical protein
VRGVLGWEAADGSELGYKNIDLLRGETGDAGAGPFIWRIMLFESGEGSARPGLALSRGEEGGEVNPRLFLTE